MDRELHKRVINGSLLDVDKRLLEYLSVANVNRLIKRLLFKEQTDILRYLLLCSCNVKIYSSTMIYFINRNHTNLIKIILSRHRCSINYYIVFKALPWKDAPDALFDIKIDDIVSQRRTFCYAVMMMGVIDMLSMKRYEKIIQQHDIDGNTFRYVVQVRNQFQLLLTMNLFDNNVDGFKIVKRTIPSHRFQMLDEFNDHCKLYELDRFDRTTYEIYRYTKGLTRLCLASQDTAIYLYKQLYGSMAAFFAVRSKYYKKIIELFKVLIDILPRDIIDKSLNSINILTHPELLRDIVRKYPDIFDGKKGTHCKQLIDRYLFKGTNYDKANVAILYDIISAQN